MMISGIVHLKQAVQRWKARTGIRSGSVAIYVGPERIRFVIPTRFLNYPVFAGLLEMAKEEYGFSTTGGLALPCERAVFEGILRLLEADEEKFGQLKLQELMEMMEDALGFRRLDCFLCREYSSSHGVFNPSLSLAQNTRV